MIIWGITRIKLNISARPISSLTLNTKTDKDTYTTQKRRCMSTLYLFDNTFILIVHKNSSIKNYQQLFSMNPQSYSIYDVINSTSLLCKKLKIHLLRIMSSLLILFWSGESIIKLWLDNFKIQSLWNEIRSYFWESL